MSNQCCVVGCTSSKPKVSLHAFPRSEKRFQQWLKAVNNPDLYMLKKNEIIFRQRVCRKHFEVKYFRKRPAGNRFVLTPYAYPTLFSKQEIESGIPTIPNKYDLRCNDPKRVPAYVLDHMYALDSKLLTSPKVKTKPETTASSQEIPVYPVIPESPVVPESPIILESPVIPESSVLPVSSIVSRFTPSTSYEAHMQPIQPAVTVTPKSLRRKIIPNVASLTPKCKKIYSKCIKLMNSRRQLNFNKRLKMAEKFERSDTFKKMTVNLNKTCKTFFWMQLRQSAKKDKGRRFSREEKIMCLSFLKKSPKGYKLLRKMFILPSRRSLDKLVENLDIEAGINVAIFDILRDQVITWPEKKKYCSIIFDEVALEPHLNYSNSKDFITGFIQLEDISTPKFADHALLFMLRSACERWRQPICFYFCEGTTPAITLKAIIKKIVAAVERAGLIPIALICDQGSTNRTAIKDLQEDTRRLQILKGIECDDSIKIGDSTMYVIFDPPHLIKCIRNNFLNKNLLFNGKVAKWNDIVEVYRMDCELGEIRLLPQLTDEHVLPDKIKKMKVSVCTKVMSERMAAMLKYTAQFPQNAASQPMSSTMNTTADAIYFFDQLFDSCNGGSYDRGKPLRCAIKEDSRHHHFWKEALKTLSSVKFLRNEKHFFVPSINNWKTTIRSLQKVWIFLNSKGVDRIYARNFNQDPVENFFGRIRAHNYRNVNPSCSTFTSSFKSLFLADVVSDNSENFNCEADDTHCLNLSCLFEKQAVDNLGAKVSKLVVQDNVLPEEAHSNVPLLAGVINENIKTNAKSFTAGYVTRKILKKHKCRVCKSFLTTKEITDVHNWIERRERTFFKSKRLTYPSPIIIRHFAYLISICNKFLNRRAHENHISVQIRNMYLIEHGFDWFNCETHKENIVNQFIDLTLKIQIYNWVTGINRILKGIDIHRLPKSLPFMQNMALDKFNKTCKGRMLKKKKTPNS